MVLVTAPREELAAAQCAVTQGELLLRALWAVGLFSGRARFRGLPWGS